MSPVTTAAPFSPQRAAEDAVAASFREGLGRMVLRFGLLVLAGLIVDAVLADEPAPAPHGPAPMPPRTAPSSPVRRRRAPGGSAWSGLRLPPRTR